MKQIIASLSVALAVLVAPTVALSFDASTITPDLTFPEPDPQPVTRDASGIDK